MGSCYMPSSLYFNYTCTLKRTRTSPETVITQYQRYLVESTLVFFAEFVYQPAIRSCFR